MKITSLDFLAPIPENKEVTGGFIVGLPGLSKFSFFLPLFLAKRRAEALSNLEPIAGSNVTTESDVDISYGPNSVAYASSRVTTSSFSS